MKKVQQVRLVWERLKGHSMIAKRKVPSVWSNNLKIVGIVFSVCNFGANWHHTKPVFKFKSTEHMAIFLQFWGQTMGTIDFGLGLKICCPFLEGS